MGNKQKTFKILKYTHEIQKCHAIICNVIVRLCYTYVPFNLSSKVELRSIWNTFLPRSRITVPAGKPKLI